MSPQERRDIMDELPSRRGRPRKSAAAAGAARLPPQGSVEPQPVAHCRAAPGGNRPPSGPRAAPWRPASTGRRRGSASGAAAPPGPARIGSSTRLQIVEHLVAGVLVGLGHVDGGPVSGRNPGKGRAEGIADDLVAALPDHQRAAPRWRSAAGPESSHAARAECAACPARSASSPSRWAASRVAPESDRRRRFRLRRGRG